MNCHLVATLNGIVFQIGERSMGSDSIDTFMYETIRVEIVEA